MTTDTSFSCTDRSFSCAACGRRIGAREPHRFYDGRNFVVCMRCIDGSAGYTRRAHARLFPDCPHAGHDLLDHAGPLTPDRTTAAAMNGRAVWGHAGMTSDTNVSGTPQVAVIAPLAPLSTMVACETGPGTLRLPRTRAEAIALTDACPQCYYGDATPAVILDQCGGDGRWRLAAYRCTVCGAAWLCSWRGSAGTSPWRIP